MTTSTHLFSVDDPFDLSRFLEAQAELFERAMAEIRAGQKRTHWIWFIFPQLQGLSSSSTSKFYAIKSVAEAHAYLAHPVLGHRLHLCAEAVMEIKERSVGEIFGAPDDEKVKSCATLFAHVSPPASLFERLIETHFEGKPDARTLELLESPFADDIVA